MGRPIKKKWFGQTSAIGGQIIVSGARFADGTTTTNAYIVSQTGDTAYMVQDTAKTHAAEILFMVNANGVGALMPGQMFVNATPFGGTALPAKKIAQYRITLFTVPNAVAVPTGTPSVSPVANYTWSTIPATKAGQVTLITETAGTGIINAIVPGVAGAGYYTAPSVTFPPGVGGGTGASATSRLSATGTVAGYTLVSGGYGYTAGAATVGAPPASVTATGTATATGGIINSVTVANPGGYYLTAPTVTFGGGGTGATGTAAIASGRVVGVSVTAGGTGYTTPTVTFGAPPAATAATATFTVTTVPGVLSADPPADAGGEEGGDVEEGEDEAAPAAASSKKKKGWFE